jgi:hypothetical protein
MNCMACVVNQKNGRFTTVYVCIYLYMGTTARDRRSPTPDKRKAGVLVQTFGLTRLY